jgi:peptide/nickel transport system substrate-binding protein
MNKKKLFLTTIILLVVFSLTATTQVIRSQADDRKKTAIFDIDGGKVLNPDVWNPFVPGNRRDHGFHQAVMEPLFILNYETGNFDPWVGESMTSDDSLKVWTLKLKKGVMWSDGQPYTADDVVFTINMLIKKGNETLSNGADLQSWVDNVKKTDDQTVVFTLLKPNPRFQLDYFAVRIWGGVNIVPEHIWKDQDPLTFKNYDKAKGLPVFSGPYKLQGFNDAGTEFTYVRDDNWWGAKSGFKPLPAPEKLIWTWAGPEEARAALMADNKLDSLMDITIGTFEALQKRNPNIIAWLDKKPFVTLDPCSRTFEFNTTVAPWDDKDMRWAINYAYDRDEIVRIAYQDTTVKSKSFFPAYAPLNRYVKILEDKGVFEKYPLWTHDTAKAQQIIESKGYTKGSDGYYQKDGKQLKIDITTHEAFIEKQRVAAVQVEELQKIGINASTRNEAGSTWGDNLNFGKFEARMGWQNCGSVNEPWASMDTLSNRWIKPVGERASNNGWRWNNARYSELVEQIGTLPLGDPKIEPLFVEAMSIYYSELPTIPITQARKLIPFNTTYWTNWPTATNNYVSSWTWWQSTFEILVSIKPAGG